MDNNQEMKYAPVIIPTLCRYEHLVRCIESLRRNTWAKHTDVYVGLDYPAEISHWDGYLKIKKYLEGNFDEFCHFYVIVRDHNLGAVLNNNLLTEECAKKYDRYILAEDDLEFSPNFLQYMDTALMAYENDPDVIAVAGYSYPVHWITTIDTTVAKQNFNASAWGRGFWFSKKEALKKYLKHNHLAKEFSSVYKSGKLKNMIDFAIKDYVYLTENGWSRGTGFLNRITDISMRIYLVVQNKYIIMPLQSKVRNHGYDGTGVYCQLIEGNKSGGNFVDDYLFSRQPIDESMTFELIEDTYFDLEANRALLNSFDRVSPKEMREVWEKAKKLSKMGKFGGAFLTGKRILKIATKRIGFMAKENNQ